MRDFTFKIFKKLLCDLISHKYRFVTFSDFMEKEPRGKIVILRHDVDRLPGNALKMARIEKELGIQSTYFFRTVKETFKPKIIREIVNLGHEVGYHYENLAEIGKRLGVRSQESGVRRQEKEDHSTSNDLSSHLSPLTPHQILFTKAIEDFKRNLAMLKELYPVKTICMHGSPTSKYDSMDLWKVYDYRDYGIIGEPYFDVDFSKVLYLTDTGRRWDGERYSVRDKVYRPEARGQGSEVSKKHEARNTKSLPCEIKLPLGYKNNLTGQANPNHQNSNDTNKKTINDNFDKSLNVSEQSEQMTSSGISFHSTFDIIEALENDLLPDQLMINTHPQRWTDNTIPWLRELVFQNVKNIFKRILVKRRS